jgi:hypothetical protein
MPTTPVEVTMTQERLIELMWLAFDRGLEIASNGLRGGTPTGCRSSDRAAFEEWLGEQRKTASLFMPTIP